MLSNSQSGWQVKNEGFIFPLTSMVYSPGLDKEATVKSQILRQLIDEERASVQDQEIVIPHEVVAGLPEEERRGLGLPEVYPFFIEIRAAGNLTDPMFRYIYSFVDGYGQPLVNPRRTGAYLEMAPGQGYLLSRQQYALIEALDNFNGQRRDAASRQELIHNNLLEFARIKGLARATAALLDMYLNDEQVIVPNRVGVRLKKVDNDTLEIEPVLYEDTGKGEQKQEALEGEYAAGFINQFDRFNTVRNVYAIPRGPRVVFNKAVKDTLADFKRYRRVTGATKEAILKNPREYFTGEALDLDSFSERVIEIGEYKPQVFPFLRPNREPWLPPEGGIIFAGGRQVNIAPGEAAELQKALEEAFGRGERELNWQGQKIPVNGDVLHAVADLAAICPSASTSTDDAIKNVRGNTGKKHVLIIKDNFKEITFSPEKQLRPGRPGLPRSLKPGVKLLEHQLDGLKWLQGLWLAGARGGLLADDMGLGKTLQALAFIAWVAELMEENLLPRKPVLIVAPVVLMENWKQEYLRFLQPILGPVIELHGPRLKDFKNAGMARELGVSKEIDIKDKEDAEGIIKSGKGLLIDHQAIQRLGIVLTTYETLRDYQFSFGLVEWSIMVLDEAQKIKTPTAMVTTAVKAMKYDFGLCLTGTPVENSLVDLWSIMDFVQPACLGTLESFRRRFHAPLGQEGTDRAALGRELKAKIDGLLLRRTKEEHLQGLPPRKIKLYEVEMPPEQLHKYIEVVRNARRGASIDPIKKNRQHIFQVIALLRDISLHPFLLYNERELAGMSAETIINTSARVKKTIEILDEIEGRQEKALVFLLSRKMQRLMQRVLRDRYGLDCAIINGEVSGGRRQHLVDAFQSASGFNVLIMSPEAAGVGLNITAANHVIHLSRMWNPAKEDQATNRVYRIGQVNPVYVHIPMAVHHLFGDGPGQGSFDQKLHRLLQAKRELSQAVLMPANIEEDEMLRLGEELLASAPELDVRERLSMEQLDRLDARYMLNVMAAIYNRQGFVELPVDTIPDHEGLFFKLLRGYGHVLLLYCKHTSDPSSPLDEMCVREVLALEARCHAAAGRETEKVIATNASAFTVAARETAAAKGIKLLAREEIAALIDKYDLSWGEVAMVIEAA
ncbi:MAG: hypothetical protein PWR22_2257 [Moorella sp. (in: firmicutes)]|nr:hypothetical protein [Moorella sp. (in: firmicutes)]